MADTKDASSSSFMTPAEATKLSKLLAYVLRHGAAKEKLTLRSDGYLLLADLVLCITMPCKISSNTPLASKTQV